METRPEPWFAALRSCARAAARPGAATRRGGARRAFLRRRVVDRPCAVAPGLPGGDLQQPARCPDGRHRATSQEFGPIWARWDARTAVEQRDESIAANEAVVARFEALDPEERTERRLSAFGMDLDAVGVAGMRLSEHAMHTWDVAVALDETATVAPDATELSSISSNGWSRGSARRPDGRCRC